MCYLVYISTDFEGDLSRHNAELISFERDVSSGDPGIIHLLQYNSQWFVGSKAGCSCTFRHLHSIALGFGQPVAWYAEDPDEIDATKLFYDVIYCSQCGQQNLENNFKCTRCSFPLHAAPEPRYVAADDSTLGGLIPYKNAAALWVCYLAVFSLIPFFGIPIGVAALMVGIRGLENAAIHPGTRGKVHAWIGIIVWAFARSGTR